MKTLRRFVGVQVIDSAEWLAEEPVISPEGYLTASVNATRPGVFEYRDEKGRPLRMLRPREEVLRQESMDTLANKPATFDHPSNLPTARDIEKYIVGAVGNKVCAVEDYVRTTVTVHVKAAIDAIKAGNREVSCGYLSDIYHEPGISDEFGPYDLIQKNIRYNHLAVGIDKGRAGHECRILMDSQPKETTVKLKIGDKEYEVPEDLHDAVLQHFAGTQKKYDKLMSEHEKLKDRLNQGEDDDDDMENMAAASDDDDKKTEAKMDSFAPKSARGKVIKGMFSKMQGKLKAAELLNKQVTDSAADPAKLAQAAREHAKIVAVGMAVIDKADAGELFKLSAVELKKKVIAAKMPKVSLEGKDQGFMDGLFEGIQAQVSPSNVGEILGAMLLDSKETETKAEPKKFERKPWVAKPLHHSTRTQATA